MKFKDKAGLDLTPGDLIVYGHALGRCAGLQYGKVLAIQRSKPRWKGDDQPGEVKLRVQGVDTNWEGRKPELLRVSVLAFSDRVLKIERTQVRADVLELLDTVKLE